MPTPQEILEELKKVKYPGYTRDIVSFGLVKDIEVASAGVTVTLVPTTANADVVGQIRDQVLSAVKAMGIAEVNIVLVPSEQPQRRSQQGRAEIPGVKSVVAIASGKGGVGKSTVAVNLALALRGLGQRVGLLDADVYGPSVPLMLGLDEQPTATDDKRIRPLQKYGIKVISLGLYIAEGTPVIWRGPMVTKLLTQFLHDVEWRELDVLLLDLPPGTGDAQLTIVQQAPLSGGVIVTTPQDVALLDVKRAVTMLQEVNAPVLGVIENMSYHICRGCGDRAEIFGHGGGQRMAELFHIPLLGEIPLVREIRECADNGKPIVIAEPDHPQSQAFREIATRLLAQLETQAAVVLPTIR